MVAALGDRAEAVRNRLVAPNEDNMLRITNNGRKLALDQRLMNPLLPDDPDSKANACVEPGLYHLGKDKGAALHADDLLRFEHAPRGRL